MNNELPFNYQALDDGRHRITYSSECNSCKGTGLYVGMAERNGIAVVCHSCKGKGIIDNTVEFRIFNGRRHHAKAKWVLRFNAGYIVGIGFLQGKTEAVDYDHWGGMSYEDWLALDDAVVFPNGLEMRRHSCPAWWYQSVDRKRMPSWDECGFGSFSKCANFPNRVACWARWDKDFQ